MYSTADTTDTAQSISRKSHHIAGRRIGSCFSHTPPQQTLFHKNVPKQDHIELSIIRRWYRRLPLAADDTDYADVYRDYPRVSSAADSTPRAVMETGPCANQSTTGLAPASAEQRPPGDHIRIAA